MYDCIIKGRIIDGRTDVAVERGIVAIRKGRLAYVGPEIDFARRGNPPVGAEDPVLTTETIMPGFIDAHAHLSGTENAGTFADGKFFGDQLMGAAYQVGILLDAGFTGIRDMSEAGLYLSRAQKRGILRSPRIMPGGKILGITSGHVDMEPYTSKEEINRKSHFERLCDGPADCLLAVREQFRMGAEFIKVCATGGVSSPIDRLDDVQFSADELKVIVEEAKRHHTYAAAHCTGYEGAYQALKAGVECIEHGVMLTEREIELMQAMDATLVSTLTVALGVASIPDLPEWMREKAKTAAEHNLRTIEMARKAGIRIALGTDFSNSKNTPYRTNGKEFASMVKAGMTPAEAIRAGTINAAYLLKRDAETGSLETGKVADIVLVKGNPLEAIECLTDPDNIEAVFLGGIRVK